MSLITQCPACSTMFKVVQDQLRISDGWVRCGQCDEVFDANAHLQPQDVQVAKANEAVEPVEAELEVPEPLVPIEDAEDHAQSSYLLSKQEALIEDVQARYPEMDLGMSFMRRPGKGSGRYGLAVKLVLSASLFLLGILLCGQVLVHERNRLAAMEPKLSPWLESLCEVVACKLAAVRQIESIVIENSSFVNVRGAVYRLNVALKNSAPYQVAVPALELTLTDLQDQAVVRRVINISDFGTPRLSMAGGADIQTTLPMNIKLPAGTDKFAGYRLVIFYP